MSTSISTDFYVATYLAQYTECLQYLQNFMYFKAIVNVHVDIHFYPFYKKRKLQSLSKVLRSVQPV